MVQQQGLASHEAQQQGLKGCSRGPWLPSSIHVLAMAVIAAGLLLAVASRQGDSMLSLRLLTGHLEEGVPTWRDRIPWVPMLTPEELARAIDYYGSGVRLRSVAAKLVAGQPVTVALLGGSITVGLGATDPSRGYAALFGDLLNATFPHRDHAILNRGIGACSSSLFAACMERMVPSDTDLVVLEFAVNDPATAAMSGPGRPQYEQLLRKLLRAGPAVVMLHHYSYSAQRADGAPPGVFWWPTEQHLSTFARFYDVTSVSIAAAAWRLMAAGVEGFRPDKYAAYPGIYVNSSQYQLAEGEEDKQQFFYVDLKHPANSGHKALAEALAAPLLRAVGEVQAQRLLPPAVLEAMLLPPAGGGSSSSGGYSRQDPRVPKLPPPMLPGNHDQRTIICAMQADFKQLVHAASGFQYRAENPKATGAVRQKWAWSAYSPGDWLELELDTRADGGNDNDTTASPVVVALSHLRSYEHMGVAEAACTSGCVCDSTRIDGSWPHRLSLFVFKDLPVTQHARCRIRVTILEDAGEVPSGEHKVVLSAAVVKQR